MLPFLKRKDASAISTSIQNRTSDKPIESEQSSEDASVAHEACARHLLIAIEARDVKAMADALYDVFTIMDAEPHEEGPHIEPHSFQAQNIKANKE